MLEENKKRKLNEILTELAELHAKDSTIIELRDLPGHEALVPLPIKELFAYGQRFERRHVLYEELARLAVEA